MRFSSGLANAPPPGPSSPRVRAFFARYKGLAVRGLGAMSQMQLRISQTIVSKDVFASGRCLEGQNPELHQHVPNTNTSLERGLILI